MARAAAKKKRDIPPLYVTVADGGRLAPAFQHDQERIMSFRKGTRLIVTIDTDGSRRGVRKWHAIIGKAVKNGLLPWVTASAADEAIRLALELYDPKKSKDGTWHRVTQSLNDLDDAELDEQIELMTALIVRLSGVDPDDFKREMAGAGDERFASDYDRPAAANDVGSPTNLPDDSPQAMSGEVPTDSPIGEDNSIGAGEAPSQAASPDATNPEAKATEDNAITTATMRSDGPGVASRPSEGGGTLAANISEGATAGETATQFGPAAGDATPEAPEANVQGGIPVGANASHSGVTGGERAAEAAGEGDGAVSPPAAELECIRKLMAIVADPTLSPKERAEILAESADIWLGTLGPDRKDFVTAVFTTSKKVLRGELQAEPAKRYLEGLAA